MKFLLLVTLLQLPTERQLLEAEHSRADDHGVLQRAVTGGDVHLQRLAVRALGRMERVEHAHLVEPLTRAPDAALRRDAINALGQMRAPIAFSALLESEREPLVRAVIFETLGRTAGDPEAARTLARGLGEADEDVRTGAARGLESFLRRNGRNVPADSATVDALRGAFVASRSSELRQLVLLALASARVRDSTTLAQALRDPSAPVRRLAVAASRQWVQDPDPQVRYQAMRVAGTCGRAMAALDDSSEHVVLAAVDILGERGCDAMVIEDQVQRGVSWRVKSRALVSLAKVSPARARPHMLALSRAQPWQVRAYVANAARITGDSAILRVLARDADPNVAAAALHSADDVRRALTRSHAGLLLEAVTHLKGKSYMREFVPQLTQSLQRLSRTGNITYRDVRMALIDRLDEVAGDTSMVPLLRALLADADPVIADRAARAITAKSGMATSPRTWRYAPAPLPPEAFMRALDGARADVTLRGLGTVTLELLTEEAPVTVAVFAQLADARRFDKLTIHRTVPNFVVQGGSPGASEYDGLTTSFMRDELGFARNVRGTVGVSTRGRDTGDGQLFINLVDNFRLDHDYTVFARVTGGMDLVDRIQEGEVIESVRIVRATPRAKR